MCRQEQVTLTQTASYGMTGQQVCVCVCVCVCLPACLAVWLPGLSVSASVSVFMSASVSPSPSFSVSVCVCVFVHMSVCVCLFVRSFVGSLVHACVRACVRARNDLLSQRCKHSEHVQSEKTRMSHTRSAAIIRHPMLPASHHDICSLNDCQVRIDWL